MSSTTSLGSCLSYCVLPQSNDTIEKYVQILAASVGAVAVGVLAGTGILPAIPSVLPEVYAVGSALATYMVVNIVMNAVREPFKSLDPERAEIERLRNELAAARQALEGAKNAIAYNQELAQNFKNKLDPEKQAQNLANRELQAAQQNLTSNHTHLINLTSTLTDQNEKINILEELIKNLQGKLDSATTTAEDLKNLVHLQGDGTVSLAKKLIEQQQHTQEAGDQLIRALEEKEELHEKLLLGFELPNLINRAATEIAQYLNQIVIDLETAEQDSEQPLSEENIQEISKAFAEERAEEYARVLLKSEDGNLQDNGAEINLLKDAILTCISDKLALIHERAVINRHEKEIALLTQENNALKIKGQKNKNQIIISLNSLQNYDRLVNNLKKQLISAQTKLQTVQTKYTNITTHLATSLQAYRAKHPANQQESSAPQPVTSAEVERSSVPESLPRIPPLS